MEWKKGRIGLREGQAWVVKGGRRDKDQWVMMEWVGRKGNKGMGRCTPQKG